MTHILCLLGKHEWWLPKDNYGGFKLEKPLKICNRPYCGKALYFEDEVWKPSKVNYDLISQKIIWLDFADATEKRISDITRLMWDKQ